MARLEKRVARIAETLLAEWRFVRPVDLRVGLGWLAQPNVDRWERARVTSLDLCVGVDADKVAAALAALRRWAEDHGLKPSEAEYEELQFTAGGDPDAERAYRTHWASAELLEPVVARPRRPRDIVVIAAHSEWTCAFCGDTGEFSSQGQGRCIVPGLRRPRPPRVSAFRRCRTHPSSHEGQPTVRCRGALEHATQSL
ncbi:hypothetical protein [Mycobacterium sp.]|uniref:hypothetical protein n=1 Tax=Mycobacterium sp. TaxID=1785 RepID=UPI00333EA561